MFYGTISPLFGAFALKKFKKILRGIVVSNKTNKTAVLLVETKKTHSRYQKKIKWSKKYLFHDEENLACEGDEAEIIESRPYSRCKKFVLSRVVEKV